MKKLLLAGLLIATTLLLLLSGCKIGGKAIALPNVTATDIANFPYQFLTSTANTIGYSTTTIFAPAAYSTEVTDLMNFMRQKACQLANSQGYGCVDSQGNPITGGAVFGLTGMSVAGQAVPDTTPIYRCWLNFHGVMNHFVSFNSNCDGQNVDSLIGHLYMVQKPDTVAVYQCRRGTRYEHRTYYDNFVSTDANCEGNEGVGLLGYAPINATADTKPIYRCWNRPDHITDGKFDHMISEAIGCEGYANEGIIFNFFKTEMTSAPPWDNGHTCDADSQCKSSYCSPSTHVCEPITIPMYRCYYNFHGVLNHFLSKDQGCSGQILDHLVGYLIQPALQNTIPLYQCYRQTRYDIPDSGGERTYTDHFVAENACPSGSISEGLLGHSLMRETDDTNTAYNCATIGGIRDSQYDHMISLDLGCEASNYRNTGEKYYFLKTETLPATLPGPLPTELTRPVYRCLRNFHGVINHYVSFNQNCETGDSPEGLMGYVYTSQLNYTHAIYQCYRSVRTARPGQEERTYHDHFVSPDANCEGNAFDNLIGYLPDVASSETDTVYRCWTIDSIDAGRYDHMLSKDLACESTAYRTENVVFNFLNTATPTGIPLPPPLTPTLSGPGEACTQTSNCQTGYECLGGYCTIKNTLYACDAGFPSAYPDCTDPNTGYSGSGKLIGYGLEPSINVPGTAEFGYCTDEYGLMSGLAFMEAYNPCSRGFQSVVRVFNSQVTGTVPLVSCSDYNNNYFIGSANAVCPASYPIGGSSGKYIYPEPYCGDGNVVSPEQCEPPGTATCNTNCQNIVIIPPPANVTNVTNYTYVPPTSTTPPTTTPITVTTNYIAIGTCTDNLIISDNTYGLGMTACANLLPGEAIILLKQVGTITGLIIAGGSPADVNPAVQVLKNLTKWGAEGSRLEITNNAYLTTVGRLSSTAGAWRYNMEYHLPAGIHFIGVPFSIASKTIANMPTVLTATGGIFAYDITNTRNVKFDVGWPPTSPPVLSDLTTFGNELEAYYVKMSTAGNFMLTDAALQTTMTRNIPAAGWAAYTPYSKQKALTQIIPVGVTVNSLWCYENNQFVQKNLALNPTIDVGQGCWIDLASGATLQ